MKTLDVISTQLNFNNLLNQAGYNLSEIVVKRYSAAPAFNEGHWLFIAEQDNPTLKWSVFFQRHQKAESSMSISLSICSKIRLMTLSPETLNPKHLRHFINTLNVYLLHRT